MCPPMDKSYSAQSLYSSTSEDSAPSMGPYEMYSLEGSNLEMGMQQLSPVYSSSVESSYFGSPATPELYHDYAPPTSYTPDIYTAVNMYQNISSAPNPPWTHMQEPCYSEPSMTPEPCDIEMYGAGSALHQAPLEVAKYVPSSYQPSMPWAYSNDCEIDLLNHLAVEYVAERLLALQTCDATRLASTTPCPRTVPWRVARARIAGAFPVRIISRNICALITILTCLSVLGGW